MNIDGDKFLQMIISGEGLNEFGFLLNEHENFEDVAFLLLRTALESYFSIYQIMKSSINEYYNKNHISYPASYYDLFYKSIISFFHFFELIIKNHPVPKEIIKGKNNNIGSFIKELRKSENNKRIDFLHQQDIYSIDALRCIRNKVIHEGTYSLHYDDFDKLIGKYVLPIVEKIICRREMKKYEKYWKYKQIKCSIDPIHEIVKEFKENKYDYKKVAWLQEIGRAAYQNPIYTEEPIECRQSSMCNSWGTIENSDIIRNTHVRVENELSGSFTYETTMKAELCPVCGIEAIVKYIEEIDFEIPHIDRIKCHCCSFEVRCELGNPEKHNLKLDDFFTY